MNKISLCLFFSLCTIIHLVYGAESSKPATAAAAAVRATELQARKDEFDIRHTKYEAACRRLASAQNTGRTYPILFHVRGAAYFLYEASKEYNGEDNEVTKAALAIYNGLINSKTRHDTINALTAKYQPTASGEAAGGAGTSATTAREGAAREVATYHPSIPMVTIKLTTSGEAAGGAGGGTGATSEYTAGESTRANTTSESTTAAHTPTTSTLT